ncbi:hypothetical protein BDV28DRAFT_159712 [Aspergillus coremiiformis]|uniref:Uncharacterized protein n=1 Tax=Aspergillus coremiiformis TaxID=138285 RepID=A0A5N6YZG6_9EURO|nr:hypothetical protein BDV28DRAFT_159712 [Aspergillus coremiiformis]
MAQKPIFHETISVQEFASTYYFYQEGQQHVRITQTPKPKSKKGWRKKAEEDSLVAEDPDAYFVHKPYVSFHLPPFTLRRGGSKNAPPICLIHEYGLWRRWKLQFGDHIAAAVDPRGVIGWDNRTNVDNSVNDDYALKGYKVRSWRLWGESGKQYHREVNRRQRDGLDSGDDPFSHQPVRAQESIILSWTSPFSRRTRWYQFTYAGVELCWKGTRRIPEGQKWTRRLMPIHHLKLIAKLPGDGVTEVVLAQFFCSFAGGEFGNLVIRDTEIAEIFRRDEMPELKQEKGRSLTRIHEMIIATSLCMVLGEFEKRKVTIELLIEMACSAAG